MRNAGGEQRVLLTEQPRSKRLLDAVVCRVDDTVWKWQRVSHHGAVQPVLSHDARLAPRLLRLAPLGSSVLEPHLSVRQSQHTCIARRKTTHLSHGEAARTLCRHRTAKPLRNNRTLLNKVDQQKTRES